MTMTARRVPYAWDDAVIF